MKRAYGITLVEVMMTLAVIGVVWALAAPSLGDMINRRRTLAVAEQLMADLAFARAETGLRNQAVGMTFDKDSSQSCYSVYYMRAASTCFCTAGQGEACKFFGSVVPGMEVRTISLPVGQGVSVTPDPLHWAPGNDGRSFRFDLPQMVAIPAYAAFDIKGTSGAHLRLQVNQMGRVSLCSVGQQVGGVALCPQ